MNTWDFKMHRRKRSFPLTVRVGLGGLQTQATSWRNRQGFLIVIYFIQLTFKETMKADWTLPSKLSHSQAALPPWKERSWGHQYNLAASTPHLSLTLPTTSLTLMMAKKEPAAKMCLQIQLVVLQWNWQSGYYHPPFHKNESFRGFIWAGILLEQ